MGTVVTNYVYDAQGQLAAEYAPQPAASDCGTPTCYFTEDHLGSTRLVIDSNGNAAKRFDYLPFGEETFAGVGGRTATEGYLAAPDPLNPKFTGKLRDNETGLDFMEARYYSSAQGRFTIPDWASKAEAVPYANLADPQSLNLYAYVHNNPVSALDPDGHCNHFIPGTMECEEGGTDENLPYASQDVIAAHHQAAAQHDEQDTSTKGTGFLGRLKQRFTNLFSGHGFKTNMQLMPVVTSRLVPTPDFYSLNGSIGYLAGSVSYVPATNNVIVSPGGSAPKSPFAFSATVGWSNDPEGYLTGPSGGGCAFYGIGGCAGVSTSGATAKQFGIGNPQWGFSGGYGLDWNSTSLGMYESMPVVESNGAVGIGDGLAYNPCVDQMDCF
jgi:RHS repeat-associated protein